MVAYSADRTRLAIGGRDATVAIGDVRSAVGPYPVPPDELMASAPAAGCGSTPRSVKRALARRSGTPDLGPVSGRDQRASVIGISASP